MEKIILNRREAIILFFLFLFIIILLILGIAIYTSKIGIEIENLKIDTNMPKGKKINEECKVYIFLKIFKKIKIIKINIKNIENIEKKVIKIPQNKNIKINYKELLKNINIEIEQIDLKMQIGTSDAATTAILIGIIAGILGTVVRKPKYEINPVYINKNILNIKLNCIISFDLVKYIGKNITGMKFLHHT